MVDDSDGMQYLSIEEDKPSKAKDFKGLFAHFGLHNYDS